MIAVAIAVALAAGQAPPRPVLAYDDALREAQAHSLDLERTRAQVEQAKVIAWKVWANHLPLVVAGGSWTHNSAEASIPFGIGRPFIRDMGSPQGPPAGGSVPGGPSPYAIQYEFGVQDVVLQKQDQLGAQVAATVPLVAPELWFGISAAEAGQRQAELSLEAVRRDILFGVAQIYYAAVVAQKAAGITAQQLAIARDQEKDARVRFEAGSAPKVALLRAGIDRARAEKELRAAEAAHETARQALATALGRREADFEVAVPPAPVLPAREEPLEETALRDRPDVRAADEGLRVAERTRGSVWARYLPSLGGFGRWQWANVSGFTGKQDSWAAGLAVSWILLDGTLREAQLREAGAQVAAADAGRRSAQLRARDEVIRARVELDAAVANAEKAREQAELAREGQKLVEVSFKAGAATYIEVSDANGQLFLAEISSLIEQARARLAALRLLQAAGRFDPS